MASRLCSILLATAFAYFAITGVPAYAQSAPRAADGKPDLNGIWQALNAADWSLEAHAAGPGTTPVLGALYATPPGQSVVEGGEIPYLPGARVKQQQNFAKRQTDDPAAKCFMPGVPRATYMPYPFQIVQGDGDILFVYEFASANRVVHMAKHEESPVDSWMGWSNGHWEGDTLVIEVSGFNDGSWFDRAGNYHSTSLKVTERYTLKDKDHIQYEATIDDPETYSKPWKISLPLYRLVEPNAQLLEFKCVEFSEELLYGDLTKKTK
jgi:hypothetical protein